jgi:TrmH family RNA methyltransferase
MTELPPTTSSQNRQISQVRRWLARPRECRRDGVLIADGVHLIQEALRAGLPCRSLFATVSPRDPEINALAEEAEFRHLPLYRVLDHLFRVISPVETPQGIVGVFGRPRPDRSVLWAGGVARGHVAVASGLQDPTNIGVLARSALAAGLAGMVTTPGTVDPFHHRALRAAQGASFHIPILVDQPLGPTLAKLRNVGYRVAALTTRADTELTHLDAYVPTAILLGAEGSGLDPALEELADVRVRIPMENGVESLGVAAAGAVAFFWLRLTSRNGRPAR